MFILIINAFTLHFYYMAQMYVEGLKLIINNLKNIVVI